MAGQQSTLPGLFDPRVALERIVRPFESFKERRDQILERRRLPPDVEEEAEICWGQPGDFEFEEIDGGGFKVVDDKDDDKEKPNDGVHTWSEVSRTTKKIRVENPDDADQHVVIRRIESITFRAPGGNPFKGQLHKFVLNHPSEES